jgi:hypothetical protein
LSKSSEESLSFGLNEAFQLRRTVPYVLLDTNRLSEEFKQKYDRALVDHSILLVTNK